MSSDYKLIIKNTSGVKVAEVYDYHTIAYTKRVNDAGIATIQLNGGHSLISTLANNYQVEIHRRNADLGLDWYADYYGLYRSQDRFYTDRPLFTMTCPEKNEQLRWRYVAWYAGTTNRTEFTGTSAEYIMKTLVATNITALATSTSGRIRNGNLNSTISVQTFANNGNTLDWSCAWKNLLGELQAIARVGGGDFDLVPSSTAGKFRFEWFTGQRGTDLSSTVIFALERGNMSNPIYRYNRLGERTVAIVAGQGETSNRATAVRTGADYTGTNDIEVFVDARNYSTTSGLNAAGDKRLDETQARQEFEYKVLQTPASAYGVHYCTGGRLGDLITARYDTVQVTQKIVGVTVTIAPDGTEKIDVETETQ